MKSPRRDQRANDALRPLRLEPGFQTNAYASILITMGGTRVSCSVTLEKKVPPFLVGRGQGWITAEYGMLPCATNTRCQREATSGQSGRSQEIQRLIGRSLRMMVDLKKLGEHTLRVDCDVLTADGGTRTASITGAALALRAALRRMAQEGLVAADPPIIPIAAISVGLVAGEPRLDLDYEEDSSAEADANFVMTHAGRWVEMQCTAEGRPLSQEEFDALAMLARKGIFELLQHWRETP
ncbi:MAG: ribonuclease PH [Desulfobacterales bacterium CG2_30_60_27]|nr:MAG: ribonuclease PH [Desulfobacterales bacterium CG2_30_60_27]